MVWPKLYSETAPSEGLKEGVAVVGPEDGSAEGSDDGATLGAEDGATEGDDDGATVGPNDGIVEGRDDGAVVATEGDGVVVRAGLYSQPQLTCP